MRNMYYLHEFKESQDQDVEAIQQFQEELQMHGDDDNLLQSKFFYINFKASQ